MPLPRLAFLAGICGLLTALHCMLASPIARRLGRQGLIRPEPTDVLSHLLVIHQQMRLVQTMVETADSFQGKQMDIIVLSCVRAGRASGGGSKSLGFLDDVRRINVAITRARHASELLQPGALADSSWQPDSRILAARRLMGQSSSQAFGGRTSLTMRLCCCLPLQGPSVP